MSGYNGRRAPNFSQFLEDLNTIPSPFEQAVQQQQQQQQQEPFNLDAELAMFTNAEFLDFDNLDMNMPMYDPEESHGQDKAGASKEHDVKYMDLLNADFNLPDFSQTDLNAPDSQMMQMQAPPFPAVPSHSKATTTTTSSTDHATPISAPTPQTPAASTPAPSRAAGTKRKQSTQNDGARNLEEASRLAAEEDKRRRNTAASARFRVKKKQREQTLERTVKEATEKNAALEARVQELERENKWLKDLITEKNGGTAAEAEEHGSELALMFKKFLASQKPGSEKVGTAQPVNDVSASA